MRRLRRMRRAGKGGTGSNSTLNKILAYVQLPYAKDIADEKKKQLAEVWPEGSKEALGEEASSNAAVLSDTAKTLMMNPALAEDIQRKLGMGYTPADIPELGKSQSALSKLWSKLPSIGTTGKVAGLMGLLFVAPKLAGSNSAKPSDWISNAVNSITGGSGPSLGPATGFFGQRLGGWINSGWNGIKSMVGMGTGGWLNNLMGGGLNAIRNYGGSGSFLDSAGGWLQEQLPTLFGSKDTVITPLKAGEIGPTMTIENKAQQEIASRAPLMSAMNPEVDKGDINAQD